MDKFANLDDEDDFKSLGSDEEFYGGSDNESDVEVKSKSKAFDAFNESDEDDEEAQIERKTETRDTEEDKNVKELYRKSKLSKIKKPKGKTGVVYISRIPPYMKPIKMKQILSRFGEIDRIFLKKEDSRKQAQRIKSGGNKKQCYEEGWAEFIRKKDAKVCAEALNGNIIGGKKGNFYHDDILNVKYLSGFKWIDLTSQISKENEVRDLKLQLEINQAKKLNKAFISNIEKSKMVSKISKTKKIDDQIHRTFEQRPIKSTRADDDNKLKDKNSKNLDNVLSKVF